MPIRALIAVICMVCGSTMSLAAESREQVRVEVASDLALTGTLHRPESRSGAPAVVLYPGSQGSKNLPGLAEHLASRGIVALDLNKRGVSGSDGHWRDETIERQAEDVLGAVKYLRGLKGVDARHVGIVGHSQGGWVAQLAAAQGREVAFVVLLAGPTQTVRDQVLTDERTHLSGWGVPPKEVENRAQMFGELLDAALTNPAVCGPEPKHYLCGVIGYDPEDALRRIRVPVLALYGENDPMTPPELNEPQLKQALSHLGQERLETRVFPRANHVFWASKTGLRDEYGELDRAYVPGFLEAISSWILRVTQENPGSS